MATPQFITTNGLPQFAVLPYEDYIALVAKAEGFENVEDYVDFVRSEEVLKTNRVWHNSEDIKQLLGMNE